MCSFSARHVLTVEKDIKHALLYFNTKLQSRMQSGRLATILKNWRVWKFCLTQLTTVSSDKCKTLWMFTNLSHSMKLKKPAKYSSIERQRIRALIKSESLQIVGRQSWNQMVFLLLTNCCCFWESFFLI